MASDDTASIAPPERIATGLAGLDVVLGGGLFAGGLYIVQGGAGSGKTILANQISFHQARLGRRVAYLTLLGEPHDRMLQHLAALDFMDLSLLPDPLSYVSAYGALEDDGLSGLLALVRDTMRRRSPFLLVLDGLYVAQEQSGSPPEFRRFVHALQGEAGLHGCTMLFLSNGADATRAGPERTMVDGLIELRDDLFEARAVRTLHVRKLRGGAFLRGRHLFRIQDEGIVVFPRLESLAESPPPADVGAADGADARVSTGVDDLDRMLRGGIPPRSTTLVVGPSGSGKTTVGLLFLGRSTPEAPGLLFGCNEAPDELRRKAVSIGIDVDGLVGSGALSVAWHPPDESYLDEMGHRLLGEARRTGARRVVIDGIGSLAQSMVFPGRLRPFFAALARRLRAAGATTLCTAEAWDVFTPQSLVPGEVSAVAENVVLLRLAEQRSRLVRLLSVVKVRDSAFDPAVVPFEIGARGVTLGERPLGADAEAIGGIAAGRPPPA